MNWVMPLWIGSGLLALYAAILCAVDIRHLRKKHHADLRKVYEGADAEGYKRGWQGAERVAARRLAAEREERRGNFLFPKMPALRRLITRVTLDRPIDFGRWVDLPGDTDALQITAIRIVRRSDVKQTLYIKGNAATIFLPAVALGDWIKLDPIAVEPNEQYQLFRLSDWWGSDCTVEFDLDIKIVNRT